MYYIIIVVIAMTINIIIEPEYKDTVWCRETLCGIEKKVASLRYKARICSYDMLNADMENIIVVGTSPSYVTSILSKTSLLGIHTSESSVKYRIKRLLTGTSIESTAKMLEIYTKYIGG